MTAPRVFWRRSATAAGIYSSVVLGLVGTLIASRVLGPASFGVLTVVLTAVGFCQILLDLTVEEALVKYGFRYVESGDWGRLRRLFTRALALKAAGGVAGGALLAILAPFADWIFGRDGLATAFLLAALIPIAQSPETVAGVAPILHRRYDVRAAALFSSQALRLAGIAVGCHYGVTATVGGILAGQLLATGVACAAGWLAFRRFPSLPSRDLGDDRREIFRFVLRSSLATGVISLRGTLGPPLLGAVSSTTQAGFFRIAQAPQQGLGALTSPARLILLTEQTRSWERGDPQAVFRSVRRYSGLASLVMLVCVPPLYWIMPQLVRLVFGSDYAAAGGPARLILLAGAVQFVFAWTKSLPFSIGRPGLRIVTHGVEALVFLPLVVLLGLRWEVTGAAWAVLISTLVFAGLWLVLLARVRRDAPAPRPEGAIVA